MENYWLIFFAVLVCFVFVSLAFASLMMSINMLYVISVLVLLSILLVFNKKKILNSKIKDVIKCIPIILKEQKLLWLIGFIILVIHIPILCIYDISKKSLLLQSLNSLILSVYASYFFYFLNYVIPTSYQTSVLKTKTYDDLLICQKLLNGLLEQIFEDYQDKNTWKLEIFIEYIKLNLGKKKPGNITFRTVRITLRALSEIIKPLYSNKEIMTRLIDLNKIAVEAKNYGINDFNITNVLAETYYVPEMYDIRKQEDYLKYLYALLVSYAVFVDEAIEQITADNADD